MYVSKKHNTAYGSNGERVEGVWREDPDSVPAETTSGALASSLSSQVLSLLPHAMHRNKTMTQTSLLAAVPKQQQQQT